MAHQAKVILDQARGREQRRRAVIERYGAPRRQDMHCAAPALEPVRIPRGKERCQRVAHLRLRAARAGLLTPHGVALLADQGLFLRQFVGQPRVGAYPVKRIEWRDADGERLALAVIGGVGEHGNGFANGATFRQ